MSIVFDIKTDTRDLALLEAVQDGLPLTSRPFADIGKQLGLSEIQVIERFEHMQKTGIIKRFGLVLQHRSLGYRANAMIVWDVPDNQVNEVASKIIAHDFITLCYCRSRSMPDWPYNLYCMIHGRERLVVEAQIDDLKTNAGMANFATKTLFSRKRFKQTGARFSQPLEPKRQPQ